MDGGISKRRGAGALGWRRWVGGVGLEALAPSLDSPVGTLIRSVDRVRFTRATQAHARSVVKLRILASFAGSTLRAAGLREFPRATNFTGLAAGGGDGGGGGGDGGGGGGGGACVCVCVCNKRARQRYTAGRGAQLLFTPAQPALGPTITIAGLYWAFVW